MILRVPDYYEKFHCLAGACKDSCCIGWEIDIDEDTYDYYQNVQGDFGQRLREHMECGEDNYFRLNGKRCPFLNRENLCDICIELGEEALSEVCTEYPRFTVEYGNVREKSMAISCEEVGRLLFETEEKTTFPAFEIPGCYDICEQAEEQEKLNFTVEIEVVRDRAVAILQDRRYAVRDRARILLLFSQEIQEVLNREEELGQAQLSVEIGKLDKKYTDLENVYSQLKLENEMNGELQKSADSIPAPKPDDGSEQGGLCFIHFQERMQSLEGMELLDEEWDTCVQKLRKEYTAENYEKCLEAFDRFVEAENRSCEYEKLLVYFVFRYFTKAVYDCDILGKAKFGILGFLTIRDLDALRFMQTGSFSKADRVDTARIYSKEVEHSEDNIEYLLEEFVFTDCFETQKLLQVL